MGNQAVTFGDLPPGFQVQGQSFDDLPQGFTIANQPEQSSPDFADRMSSDYNKRVQDMTGAIADSKGGSTSDVINLIGGGLGLAGDTLANAAGSVGRTIRDNAPEVIKQPIANAAQAFAGGANNLGQQIAQTQPGAYIGNKLGQAEQGYEEYKQANPAEARTLGNLNNIVQAFPIAQGIGSAVEAAPALAENIAGKLGDMGKTIKLNYDNIPEAKNAFLANQTSGRPLVPEGATPEEVQALKKLTYDKADAEGGQLNPGAVNQAVAKAEAVAPQTEEGKAFAGENPTTKAVNDLQVLKNKPLSMGAYEEIDKDLTGRIAGQTDALGKVSPDGMNLTQIRQHLRDAAATAGKDNVVDGNGFASYRQAQQLASINFRMNDVNAITSMAEYADNPQTYIRNGFKRLVKQGQGGFSDDEWSDVQKAAKTGLLAGTLKTLGNKWVSGVVGGITGGLAGGGLASAFTAPAGIAIGEALGYPLRQAGAVLQNRPVNSLMNKLGNRQVIQDVLENLTPE